MLNCVYGIVSQKKMVYVTKWIHTSFIGIFFRNFKDFYGFLKIISLKFSNNFADIILEFGCSLVTWKRMDLISVFYIFAMLALLSLCNLSSSWIYENLTKILRVGKDGGNTCFGLTMRLYKELVKLGYSPKLLLGHKRHIKNAHCALSIIDKGTELFLDPGYLIFDPLPIPPNIPQENKTIFPLQPNWIRLERDGENLCLWTGVANEAAKFRFYFPLKGCSMQEFNLAWEESYAGESMKYLVFNKLDKKNSTQYYYQNGKLLTRTTNGATQQKIENKDRIEVLYNIFGLDKELLSTPFLF